MHTIHTLRAWLATQRQPWPLAGLDVSAEALCWVEMAPQPPGWAIQFQDSELLPAAWGDPGDISTWDTLVLGSALQRLRLRAHAASRAAARRPTAWVAMGLDGACLREDVPDRVTASQGGFTHDGGVLLGATRDVSPPLDAEESREFYWDEVPATHDAPAYRVSTPRSVVLALQALTEPAGLELSVLEPMQAAHERGEAWWVHAETMPSDAWVRATGLALRRAHPWGWAC